jgi:hypothetical protein
MSEKKCPTCGASIDLNAAECKYCGEAIAMQTPQYQSPQAQPANNYAQNNYAQGKFMNMKLYFQQEFSKISDSNESYKGKWNWPAFFFSPIWGFTKGLWALSLISLGASMLLLAMDISFLGFGISIFWGLRGNYCYYNLVTKKTQLPSKF